ncbi:MAG: GIY-YIG nuclease family protein [Nitrospirota bacterium]|nr:GIY-YIG nuclease family protein [Nitrospirota bacterium]
MPDSALFTDVSVDPGRRIGVGAYLLIPAAFLETSPGTPDTAELAHRITVRRFEDTSSAKLELQTVLWAIQEQRKAAKGKLSIYTDSQSVSSLLKRRPGLLADDFVSRRTKRPLNNAVLYRAFYKFHDALGFDVIKVQGHARSRDHDAIHRIFSLLDRKARKTLKMWMAELATATQVTARDICNEDWCVYVLRCRNNSLYIGMTNNIERRLKEHEQGRGSKFVRSWRPFELVKTIPCKNAGEARRLEYNLKQLTRREKIDTLELLFEPIT